MSSSPIRWFPVAPCAALRADDNIVAGFLPGRELALWRSRGAGVQAWENRCPHRGMRLTLGSLVNGRLVCAYHGWAFRAADAACESIPAHPGQEVPANVCVRQFPSVESQGMVWVADSGLDPAAVTSAVTSAFTSAVSSVNPSADTPEPLPAPGRFARSMGVRASGAACVAVLARLGFASPREWVCQGELARQRVTLFVNEVDGTLSLLHAWLESDDTPEALRAVLAALSGLRASIESAA